MPGCASPPTGFLELLTWVDLSKQATILEQADSLSATGIRSRHSNRNTGTFSAKPFSCRSPTATKRAASSSQSSRTSPEMRSHWRQLRCKADKRTAPWRRTDHYVRLRVHRRGCQSGHSGSLKRRRKAARRRWMSAALCTAFVTLSKEAIMPSPVCLTSRPPCASSPRRTNASCTRTSSSARLSPAAPSSRSSRRCR